MNAHTGKLGGSQDSLAVARAVRPIPRFPGYFAGDEGAIYSTRGRWVAPGRLVRLRPGLTRNGYWVVNLVLPSGAKQMARVHVLVCEAWHGPRPLGHEASHRNDRKDDNRPGNLAWETPEQNQARRHANGIDDRGTRNTRAVLTPATLAEVRNALARGETTAAIARRLGVSRPVISRVKNGHRYQHDA